MWTSLTGPDGRALNRVNANMGTRSVFILQVCVPSWVLSTQGTQILEFLFLHTRFVSLSQM